MVGRDKKLFSRIDGGGICHPGIGSDPGMGFQLHKQEPARKTDRRLFLRDKIMEKIFSETRENHSQNPIKILLKDKIL